MLSAVEFTYPDMNCATVVEGRSSYSDMVYELFPNHMASKWQSQDSNPVLLTPGLVPPHSSPLLQLDVLHKLGEIYLAWEAD